MARRRQAGKTPAEPTAKNEAPPATGSGMTYAASGVSIEEGDRFAAGLRTLIRRTHGPRVLDRPGGFAGLLRLDYNEELFRNNYRDPVLVACCDGVGTKIKLAAELGIWDTIGIDLVAMSVNDLIVEGAEPLLFLDYIACNRVDHAVLTDVAKGISDACRSTGSALLGGETAEMPDVYPEGEIDLAGFAVGVVELKRATDPARVEPGDVILGLASDGVHSNGFSLVRSILKRRRVKLNKPDPALDPDRPVGEVLLTPTRLYAAPIVQVLRGYRVKKVVTGMAHITGGGLAGNIERALHDGVDAVINRKSWPVPPVFRWLASKGPVDPEEMDRVFNMGVGYTLIVRPTFAESIATKLTKLGETVYRLGVIKGGSGKARIKG